MTMAEAQRAYDNLTPEDVYGPEDEAEETEVEDECDGDCCTVRIGG